ncbi:MAG: hypothetical protein HPAVJP_3570 [Candidatus Hepatoplasma vulgare]|nr:MAG: hypothetical protein HPAVJP_3570 [Candidatus Hepatoplasma sp.]
MNNTDIANEIYQKDAIKFMKELEKEKIIVDAIITDPPYNISRKNNFNTMGRQSIDFGKWDNKFNQTKWIKNASKIIKSGGTILIFNDWKNMGKIAKELEKNDFIVKDLIRWIKPNPMPRNVERRYVIDAEYIIWAVKKGKNTWTFNKENDKYYLKPEFIHSSKSGRDRFHPNQKPENLISDLIKIHTNKKELIYDPFSGSGEISIVAKKENRNFIATELDKNFYEKSINRKELREFNRPIFNYLGNKYRIINILINKFSEQNDIKEFIDVFTGSGIVFSSISNDNFKNLKKIIVNDKEKVIIDLLKYINKYSEKTLINDFKKTLCESNIIKNKTIDKDAYNQLKEKYNKIMKEKNKKRNKEERERERERESRPEKILLILILYGFNHQIRFNSKNEFNIPPGKYLNSIYIENKILSFKKNLKNKNIIFKNDDFENLINKIIEKNESLEGKLFYFDPPYLLANKTYNKCWTKNNEIKLINLLEKITEKKGKWVLSNFLFAKEKENKILKEFINKNKSKLSKKELNNLNYANSNYQKKKKALKEIEILLWNW